MPLTPEERIALETTIADLEAQLAEHRAALGIADPIAVQLQQIGQQVERIGAAVQPTPPQAHYAFQSPGDVPFVNAAGLPHDDAADRLRAQAEAEVRRTLAEQHAVPAPRPKWQADTDVPYSDPYHQNLTPKESFEAAQRKATEAQKRLDDQQRRR